jgi:hypothetical protein
MNERRTRLVVDIVWNGPDAGGLAKTEHYHDDNELADVAGDWIVGAFTDRDDSPRVHVTAVDGASADRSRDSGEALLAVRSVLSGAESALERLGPDGTKLEWPPRIPGQKEWENYRKRAHEMFEDPDAPAMRNALRLAVGLLNPWRKTGRTTRSTCL